MWCRFLITIHGFNSCLTGRVISAYKKPADNAGAPWIKIGKGNPGWPQAFYPMDNKSFIINPQDYLAARCVYDSTGRDRVTKIG